MSKKETVDESTKEIKKATKTAAEKTSKTTKAIADPDKKAATKTTKMTTKRKPAMI